MENFERIQNIAQNVANILSHCDSVHSTRFRAKDPNHLLEKIVRKRIASPKRIITKENYASEITDLAGVRGLHIFKTDWAPIDFYINDKWKQAQKKIAYIREGDGVDCSQMFKQNGCKIQIHKKGYRSVHYIIKPPTEKDFSILCEIQIRTLFEEAWGEIDHKLRYPRGATHSIINDCLNLINRMAGIGDELSSVSGYLTRQLKEAVAVQESMKEGLKNAKTSEATLKAEISKLKAALEDSKIKNSKNASVRALADSAQVLGRYVVENQVRAYPPVSLRALPDSVNLGNYGTLNSESAAVIAGLTINPNQHLSIVPGSSSAFLDSNRVTRLSTTAIANNSGLTGLMVSGSALKKCKKCSNYLPSYSTDELCSSCGYSNIMGTLKVQ